MTCDWLRQVPDIYDTGYTSDFNAGVLSLRPSVKVFKALMKALPKLGFDRSAQEGASYHPAQLSTYEIGHGTGT